MDTSKFDDMLDASSESFVEDFKKALGLLPGETLQFITPQFTRTDGRVIQWTPKTAREFDALKVMKHQHLKDAGCQKWNDTRYGALAFGFIQSFTYSEET